MNINKTLTIIIPTYNRYNLLLQCIQNIINIFTDVNIIIGDSNKNKNFVVIRELQKNNNILYLDLVKYENNLYKIYKNILEYVLTPYLLIVEDDDLLINQQLHNNILNQYLYKNTYNLISFASKFNNDTFLNSNFVYESNNKLNILKFWDGKFQFGQMYYNVETFKKAFNLWFYNKPEHTFIGTTDEAIALISIYLSDSYYHINKIGLNIGVHTTNMSWNNFALSLYASHQYIDELAILLKETKIWVNLYKQIQFRELKTLNSNITYNDVFNNKYLINLNNLVRTQLINKEKTKDIYQTIKSMMVKYIQIKHL